MTVSSPSAWSNVAPYLDRALDLAGPERDAWIDELATTQPLIAASLRKMLARHAVLETEGFLAHSSAASLIDRGRAGTTVGAYRLERLLGRGGMGEVWLAARSDGRYEGQCAIKFLEASAASPRLAERFRREGSFLARLAHPNIGRLLDAGATPDGQPYLALEFIDGVRIDRYCDQRSLTIEQRVRLFVDVVAAVAHAHSQLIVHRDLKPTNVLVTHDGTVKLLDFGIAKLLVRDDDELMTRAEEVVLTPEYAAPEQLLGEPPTAATDVYQLGMLLYVLLTGRHPAPMTGTRAERMRAALDQVVPPASTMADKRLCKALQGDVDAILSKALRKQPGERYPAAQALQDDLQRYLNSEPVHARRGAAAYRARKFVVRHRIELTAAVAIILALLAGTGIAINQARTSSRERDRALEELRRAEALNDFSGFLLTEATPRGKPVSQEELLTAGEALVEQRYATDPKLRVHLLLALAARYEENQQFDAWRRVLQRAYDTSRGVDDAALHAYAKCWWSQQFLEQGESAKAMALIEDALRTVTASSDHLDYESGCRITESIIARRMGDGPRAVAAAERAVAIEALRPGIPERELEAHTALASALNQASRFVAADAAYRRLETLMQEQGLGGTRGAAIFYNNWAAMLLDSGQSLRAVTVAARAVELARKTDSDNGASLTMLTTYGLSLSNTGDHVAAAAVLDEALAKSRAAGSANRRIGTLSIAINAASAAGDATRAVQLLAEAERVLNSDRSAFSRGVVQAATARVSLAKGDTARAVEWARRAVATFESAGLSNASLVAAKTALARALNANGQHAEALTIADLNLATALGRKTDLKYTSTVGAILLETAIAQRGVGEFALARGSIKTAMEQLDNSVGANAEISNRARQVLAGLSESG